MQDYSDIVNNIETIKKMAEHGDADAQNKLGICYYLGLADITKNDEEAVKWFTKAADQGFSKAQSNLAFRYLHGEGATQNVKLAVNLFEKAAEQGIENAQHELGRCYFEGNGVKRDYKKAVECFSSAAKQGHSDAQLDLGYCYSYGKGIHKNIKKAFEWYEKSALLGNAIAQANLGYCFEIGEGTSQSYEKAIEWYSKAAAQGNARAMNNLGLLYERGLGAEKDYQKSFDLYKKGADKGYVAAIYNVGYCLEHGIGTKKNLKEAESWYSNVVDKGNHRVKKDLNRVREEREKEEFMSNINFSTRQKVKSSFYLRVIPLGKNFIVRRKGLWGIIDKNEAVLLPIKYTRVHWFEGGYAGLQVNNKWGLVDSDGRINIAPQYDTIKYLSQYHACEVEKDGDQFVVDTNNQTILKIDGKNVRFETGKLVVCSNDGWQLFNLDGTPFSKIHPLIGSEGNHWVGYDGRNKRTIIKEDGKEVQLPPYEIGIFFDHISQFRYQDKYGIIDDNANIVVPNRYDYINLGSGVIAINEGTKTKDNDNSFLRKPFEGRWLFWNYQFHEITPYRYENMGSAYKGDGTQVWFGKRDGRWYEITPNGEQWFANNDTEYKKKKETIERRRREKKDGQFAVLSDPNYKKDGRKLFVRACDGKVIRHFYYTPYLAMPLDELTHHWKIGESLVNSYGQEMPNPHALKMPKQKKTRHIFKLNEKMLSMSDSKLMEAFVAFAKRFGIERDNIIILYAIYDTKRKRAILIDWLIRKYERNKKFKMSYDELALLAVDIENWDKKRR